MNLDYYINLNIKAYICMFPGEISLKNDDLDYNNKLIMT
jgi:hypothetical protein